MDCDGLRELDAELALGIVTGRDRAEALAHLGTCPACREGLRSLASITEALTGLTPGAEPPAGFESRVVSRLSSGGAAPSAQSRIRTLVAAAAALAVLTGAAGWVIGHHGSGGSPGATQVAATLDHAGSPVGEVYIYPGTRPWLAMAVGRPVGASMVRCQVVEGDGTVVTVGTFALASGQGYWASSIPVSVTGLTGARLVGVDGAVVASATIPATG